MARNIVPPDGVDDLLIGTRIKRWLKGFFKTGLDVNNGANAPVNTLQRSTAYAVGDVVQSDAVHAKYYLKCTTAGTTGNTDPDFTGATSGSTVTDGTAVWKLMEFASTEYADKAAEDSIMALVDSAPGTLDTLAELAAALGDDPNFATTIATLIDTKCARAKLDAHPVGSFYESTDPTSPAELFGGTWEEKIPDGELIGSIAAFAGSSLPSGWLLCDGSAISRTTYSALFSAVGTIYGSGDGTDTFNVPNLGGRVVIGSGTGTDSRETNTYNVGATGGEYSHQLSVAETPAHAHTVSWQGGYPISLNGGGSVGYKLDWQGGAKDSGNIIANNVGGGGLHNNVQPYTAMQYAIYTGNVGKHCWIRQS